MAFMVDFSVEPRYCPNIDFRPDQGTLDKEIVLIRRRTPYAQGDVPTEAIFRSDHKTIPDFAPIEGRFTVCQEVRDLIESMEPGVHQFMPVRISRNRSKKPIFRLDGRELTEPYYLLHVTTFLNSVWIERSDVNVNTKLQPPLILPKLFNYNITLRREIVEGHHVWHEDRIASQPLLFSDALMAAVTARRFRKLSVHQLREE